MKPEMTPERHRRLMELFGRACDLPAGDVPALVAEVRTGDPELATELDALLAADRENPALLDTAAAGPEAALAAAVDALASGDTMAAAGGDADAPLPARVGRYRVLRRLGEGGMGVVYEAEQEQPLRKVAVKVVRTASASPTVRRRFAFESEVLARLDHPGVAHVYESGTFEGQLFFAMELVEGDPLTIWAEKHRRDMRGRLELLARVCDAVHHAHMKGVLHRDLKPGNILVEGDGQPKILDFGIARVLDPAAGAHHTVTGDIIGTPSYMSPEQTALDPDALDARSDVYTLGVIGYELLAGRLPYLTRGKAITEVIRLIQQETPAPIGEVVRSLRGDVATILATALAKEPARRYQSAAALAEDIRRFLRNEPITARPPSLLYELGKFARRSPGLTAALAALLLSLVAGVAVTSRLYFNVEKARGKLARRNGELSLLQARSSLLDDPTRALAWLAALPAGAAWDRAFAIAHEASGRGAAVDLLVGHQHEVRWSSFSPDGKLIATAGYDHTVRIWDRAARTMRVLRGHTDEVKVVAFSPDGQLLASGAQDGTVRLWTPDGRPAGVCAGHTADVEGVLWLPRGDGLASVSLDGSVRVWNRDASPRVVLRGPPGQLESFAVSPDGTRFAAAGADGAAWLWRGDGTGVALRGNQDRLNWVDFSPDGKTLVSASIDGTLLLWDVETQTARPLGSHPGELRLALFSPDGELLASGDRDGRIRLWRLSDGTMEQLAGHTSVIRHLAFSPDGRLLASAGSDRMVRLWDVHTGSSWLLAGHAARVRHLAFSPDGRLLASSASDDTVRIWQVAGRTPAALIGHHGAVLRVAFSPDGGHLTSSGADGSIRIWTLADGRERVLSGHRDQVYDAAYSADGKLLVSAGRDKSVRLWNVETGADRILRCEDRPVRVVLAHDGGHAAAITPRDDVHLWTLPGGERRLLTGHQGRIDDVAFSPDGRLLATASEDRTVRLWDVDTGSARVLEGFTAQATVVAFSPDGAALAASGGDGTIRIWAVAGGAPRVLAGHDGPVYSLAFSPDGRWIASGGADRSVRVWPLDGAAAPVVLRGHAGTVTTVAFVRAGLVASGSEDGAVRLWDLARGRSHELQTDAPVRQIDVSPDGRFLAAAGDSELVRLWPTEVPADEASVRALIGQLTTVRLDDEDGLTAPWTAIEGE